MSNLVNAKWLIDNLNNEKLVIVDCRFNLMDKEYGKKSYEEGHIKGAKRVDIEKDLSSVVKAHGGRHPIPSIEELKSTFENIGINDDSIVISYDEGDLSGASRLWWILKYLGHDKVYVLNGGLEAYKEEGGEISIEETKSKKGDLTINVKENMKVDMNYVKERVNNEKIALVDSREYQRYIGEFEPVDKKAGHIPGALNFFWMDILKKVDDKYYLKSSEELKKQFNDLNNYDEVIVYCGSGITACPNSLALSETGINHKLYAGSFSDWISYDENEVSIK